MSTIVSTETNTNPGGDEGWGDALMKSTGGRGGHFLQLGMKGGRWEKTDSGRKWFWRNITIAPLLRICWVLVI